MKCRECGTRVLHPLRFTRTAAGELLRPPLHRLLELEHELVCRLGRRLRSEIAGVFGIAPEIALATSLNPAASTSPRNSLSSDAVGERPTVAPAPGAAEWSAITR
jgi:hypothetical protein